jgi:GH15 family glucan-1,4-alpha-glucosidase
MRQTLDLALVGNGAIGALVSREAEIVWTCVPRFDGDPVFCSLLRSSAQPDRHGLFAVEMIGAARSEQQYMADTPILVTRLFDAGGAGIQVTDFAPRFQHDGTVFSPMMIVRRIERISGGPTIRILLRPMQHYGAELMTPQPDPAPVGSGAAGSHIRYVGKDFVLRLTTDAPANAIAEETPFALDQSVTLLLGPDEELRGLPAEVGNDFLERTAGWWHAWVGSLTIPPDWRDPIARAAITLKLNVFEETGAIIAAMTTSIPEAPDSGRNWDYRYCWLRDAYFVVAALRRLGDSATTERYMDFLMSIVDRGRDAPLEPLYDIAGGRIPDEREAKHLSGYRGMGPVRVGNQAHVQIQHDVYGEVILAARPLFFDEALTGRRDIELFSRLEPLGDRAASLFDKPDAGLWELRDVERVHTFSSVMCWAACNGLADIAARLQLGDRAAHWRARADDIHGIICRRSWNAALGAFTATMEGETLDASLLLMHALEFLPADDPRFVSTVRAIGRDLRHGEFIYRYVETDDFGRPENAFLVCTFWYIDALAAIGERDEARTMFERVLACRNRHGLLAEDLDPETREQWGNFVQTYSMAGIVDSAMRLSNRHS